MAELVDALGSGPSAGNGVEVQILFRAPSTKEPASAGFFFDGARKAMPCGIAWGFERLAMQGKSGSRLRDRVRLTNERSESVVGQVLQSDGHSPRQPDSGKNSSHNLFLRRVFPRIFIGFLVRRRQH